MNCVEMINKLKLYNELIPDEYDGAYELVKQVTLSYNNIDLNILDYTDLNAIYFMCTTTWKVSFEKKKNIIMQSHIESARKQKLYRVIDEIKLKAAKGLYSNSYFPEEGSIGIVDTGFVSFKNRCDNYDIPQFIYMCTNIVNILDENAIVKFVDKILSNSIKTIKLSVISAVLHCLNPYAFPIFNKNCKVIYSQLGLKFDRFNDTDSYIKNLYIIRDFRNSHFKFKNYKIFDLINTDYSRYYSKSNFLSDVFIDEDEYDTLKSLLLRKKNLIIQGAAGVGKTYVTKRFAYSIMGSRDDSRIAFVQFHQNYSYEDFIMGYRPDKSGFSIRTGLFFNFCKLAETNPSKYYFFIIDEINRGNLSSIFGEILMLIESDKRGEKLTLQYSHQPFSVPPNLYIIGTMNTADRSIAIIDYALRRRFSFYELEPAFGKDSFKQYLKLNGMSSELIDKINNNFLQLNFQIENDVSLGKGFKIGHSYFCNFDSFNEKWYENIVKYEIIPLLNEYWFDDFSRVKDYMKELLR